MTDQEKTHLFLLSLGVEHITQDHRFIKCTEGDRKVGGHPYHEIFFEFDNAGKFVEIGAYGL